MAVKEKSECEDMEWNAEEVVRHTWSAEEEIQLFKALTGLKPVGINKHFYMAFICERLSTALKREILPDVVWAQLDSMYNLEILNRIEPLPFPLDQIDFDLPDDEFGELMALKLQQNANSSVVVDKVGISGVETIVSSVNNCEYKQFVLSADSHLAKTLSYLIFSKNINATASIELIFGESSCDSSQSTIKRTFAAFISVVHIVKIVTGRPSIPKHFISGYNRFRYSSSHIKQ